MRLLKKTLLTIIISLTLCLGIACAANAQALFGNDSCLSVIGVTDLDSYEKTDVITAESAASVIDKITGISVQLSSSSAEDVCDAFAKALGYGHFANGSDRAVDYLGISDESLWVIMIIGAGFITMLGQILGISNDKYNKIELDKIYDQEEENSMEIETNEEGGE